LQKFQIFGHSGYMDHYVEYRANYPDCAFETRALHCADGVTRTMMMGPWYWKRLDILLQHGVHSLDDITGFCIAHANRAVKEANLNFDKVFYETFVYYIYSAYFHYLKYRDNIANDFWKPVTQRERPEPRSCEGEFD